MSSNAAALGRLRQTFGNNLEQDVLEAVLSMFNGDVTQTIDFLRAGQGDFVDPFEAAPGHAAPRETLPRDYMTRPRNWSQAKVDSLSKAMHEAHRLKNFFLQENMSFMQHFQEQQHNYPMYASVLLLLLHSKVALSTNAKSRCLAACWAHGRRALAEHLLSLTDVFQFTEVLRAVKTLDAPRRLREFEKKLQRLERQGTAKARVLGRVRNRINDLRTEVGQGQDTSCSGALCRQVQRWIAALPVEKLEFFALQMPKEPWQELSDIVHCSPKAFSLEWFLPFVFGSAAPEQSMVAQCADLTADNVDELVDRFDVPYSFLRTKLSGNLSERIKQRVAAYEPLTQVMWYYEELGGSREVDQIIDRRLANGEEPDFSYGKLMERLLFFRQSQAVFFDRLIPIAERRLHQIELPLEPPVVVLGDASYSMDVAIRTSTIIASLLAALCDADLRFFNVQSFPPHLVPRNVEQVLDVATNTRADGLTAPGCGIWEFYQSRTVVKSFIVVTDEIENEPFREHFFAQLFYRYYTEVYPARLVFVSFLDNPKEKGRMVRALENLGITPLQFRLDSRRPDLTKVDTLLGLLSAESQSFIDRTIATADLLATDTELPQVLAQLSAVRPPAAQTTASTCSSTTAQTVRNDDTDDDSCVICMDSHPDHALIECGHLVCGTCSTGLTICPFCRAPVLRTLKIFKN
jgi:hypothetical protein